VCEPATARADGDEPHGRRPGRHHRDRRRGARRRGSLKSPRTQSVPRESAGAPDKSALPAHVLEEIRELPAKYPQPRSAVMPALHLAQEELGHLTPEAMSEVAAALELDAGYVEGVATFYTLFHLEPVGKHHFYVCTNLSCSLRGSGEIVDHLKTSLGVTGAD